MAAQDNPVVWFEIPVTDLERAKAFYEHVLDLELRLREGDGIRMAWFPMSDDAYGAAGTLAEGRQYTPATTGTMIYLSTADIDAAFERVVEKGGGVVLERMSIGEYGFIGLFRDSEGNCVGLHSMS